mmetsp:Transcript_23115/g.58972  ORF Transcript_23115/g.58972 Transcript_23115/m.58972 type:complete len:229 (-) Transcript_23115:177-863(-)
MGHSASNACMRRSRVTLAMIDAAAMQYTFASPPLMGSTLRSTVGGGAGCWKSTYLGPSFHGLKGPSMSARACVGFASCSTSTIERRIASRDPIRMLISSIRLALTTRADHTTPGVATIFSYMASRSASLVMAFESPTPRSGATFAGSAHAAATTGPASGPRPASSQPTTNCGGEAAHAASSRARDACDAAIVFFPFFGLVAGACTLCAAACFLPEGCARLGATRLVAF